MENKKETEKKESPFTGQSSKNIEGDHQPTDQETGFDFEAWLGPPPPKPRKQTPPVVIWPKKTKKQ